MRSTFASCVAGIACAGVLFLLTARRSAASRRLAAPPAPSSRHLSFPSAPPAA